MPYEYPTAGGVLRLLEVSCRQAIEFKGRRRARWISSDEVDVASARHSTNLAALDTDRREPLT